MSAIGMMLKIVACCCEDVVLVENGVGCCELVVVVDGVVLTEDCSDAWVGLEAGDSKALEELLLEFLLLHENALFLYYPLLLF